MTSFKQLLRLFGICVAVGGCAGDGIAGDHIRWTEEVKLSDGKVIKLQRHTELTSSGFPVQRKGFYKYHEICYPPMNIHWKSKPGYRPDIFDIVDGKAYMHVPISDCFTCEHYGYPSTNALYFVWEGGKWKRIRHEEFPAGSQWNLTMSPSSNSDAMRAMSNHVQTEGKLRKLEDSLYFEQQRLGWKRVSDSYHWKGACKACRGVKTLVYGTSKNMDSVFFSDAQSDCK